MIDAWRDGTGYWCCKPPEWAHITTMRMTCSGKYTPKQSHRWDREFEKALYDMRVNRKLSYEKISEEMSVLMGRHVGEDAVRVKAQNLVEEGRWGD